MRGASEANREHWARRGSEDSKVKRSQYLLRRFPTENPVRAGALSLCYPAAPAPFTSLFTMKQPTSTDPATAASPASPAIADDAKSFDDRPQSAAGEDVGSAATVVSTVVVRDISFDLEDSSEGDKSESRAPGISELGEDMDEGEPSSDVINTRWCEVREGKGLE